MVVVASRTVMARRLRGMPPPQLSPLLLKRRSRKYGVGGGSCVSVAVWVSRVKKLWRLWKVPLPLPLLLRRRRRVREWRAAYREYSMCLCVCVCSCEGFSKAASFEGLNRGMLLRIVMFFTCAVRDIPKLYIINFS